MKPLTLGLAHPGLMGTSIGAAARDNGARVVWASADRSQATRMRAERAGFDDVGDLAALARESDVICSVCPPEAALDVANVIAAHGFDGIYLDANAIAPATSLQVGEIVTRAGASYVDGGIIGPPPSAPGSTRLYLAGEQAARVARLFEGTLFDARIAGNAPDAASALKMAYAAWTKGGDALLLAIRALAASRGIERALLEEWALSQRQALERSERTLSGSVPKAWRFAGELREIAATFEAAGLPGGFHLAGAEIYARLAGFKDAFDPAPSMGDVLDTLNSGAADPRRRRGAGS
ncbi:MAG: DUF1932 domain-containing protein [Gammaproteobacteria bacterium]|nr:DUF1932 domain-containing protein [Gammaproteobacteria bacterium]